MGTKKKVETKTNETRTVAPPSWTMPGISDVSGRVTTALNSLPKAGYAGDFVAQGDAGLTGQSQDAYKTAAGSSMDLSKILQAAAMGLSSMNPVSTGTYNPGAAFDINPVVQAATAPIWDQLNKQTMPGIRSSALESGAYSGDRAMSVVPGQVIGEAAEQAQRLAAQIGYQNYNDMEQRRLTGYQTDQGNALDAAKFNNTMQLNQTNSLPALFDQIIKQQGGAGSLFDVANQLGVQQEQQGINNALAKDQYAYTQPFAGLDIASNLLAQLSGNYGTTNSQGTNTQTTSSSGLGNVMQGVLGAASMIGSMPMGGPGAATLGSSLLGSLFGGKK
jgi:hypothetical protein